LETPLSQIEPEQNNFARASARRVSLRQISFGKIAAIFLVLGPPLFGLLFWLAVSLGNPVGDPLHEKLGVAFGIAFSFFGLLASYAVGLLPSLIIGFAYSRSRRRISAVGVGLIVAVLIGATVYFLVFLLGLGVLDTGRMLNSFSGSRTEHDLWLFTFYAAGAGAVSAFFCSFIAENFLP